MIERRQHSGLLDGELDRMSVSQVACPPLEPTLEHAKLRLATLIGRARTAAIAINWHAHCCLTPFQPALD